MFGKITVWRTSWNIFFTSSINDILILRNNFRIQGILVQEQILNLENFFFLILNSEEIFLGIEGGFLKIRPFFLCPETLLKTPFLRFKNKKNFYKSILISFSKQKKNQNFVIKWRENKTLLLKLKFSDKKNKTNLSRKSLIFLKNKFFNSFWKNFISFDLKTLFCSLKLVEYNFYLIYRDLWGRGFTLSNGLKFGASFLVYTNNVGMVHSFLSVLIFPYAMIFCPKNFISFGRLGTITKKSTLVPLLSYNGFIYYLNFKWHKELP
mmetsp:Transcript_4091/g.8370  ORF Transcript_4091/g.8370 Transcript_4091/m.8370 type:complete len:265 (+) Transcript_4091:43-837(+)